MEDKKSDRCYVPSRIYNEWIKHRPIANAGVAVVNPKKEILILKRKKGSTKGKWELPSGGICMCELPKQAAIRELKEETGIEVKTQQLKELKTVTAFHPGDRTDIVITFLVETNKKVVRLSDEHYKPCWLPLQEYDTHDYPMHDATRKQIKAAYCYVFGDKISPSLKKEIC